MSLSHCLLAWSIAAQILISVGEAPQDALLMQYEVKACKHTLMPTSLESRAYTTYTGEVHVHDVFGLPSTIKRHVLQFSVSSDSLLTLQAEVHRDTPATLAIDVYRRGDSSKNGKRILLGKNMLGAGGEDTKAFLHGMLRADKDRDVDIVFNLVSVEVASSQVDSKVSEAKCWPVRLDLTVVPTSRAAMHVPLACPSQDRLPPPMGGKANQVLVLDGKTFLPMSGDQHYSFSFADERPWGDFKKSLWSSTLEVPPRLHRFVRFFLRTSFRFASGPLQLAIELFDLKDTPDGDAEYPKCAMGCLGGVPVHNGQVVDHAMPTGFRYKLWLLAASMGEWTDAIAEKGRQCLEFDFEYSVQFEQKLTPFELGPSAWMCEFSRLPSQIIQSATQLNPEKLGHDGESVYGRSIWIRDRFGMPPTEVEDMEHRISLDISEPCTFRATTHHSDGVDIHMRLTRPQVEEQICKTSKHPGPVPRQTIFCLLEPGSYTLTFFAEYPLGGLHPCSDFFAQVALRPTALGDRQKREQCIAQASDMGSLQVQRSLEATTKPKWTAIRVPIDFYQQPSVVSVWSQQLYLTAADVDHKVYLRMVLHSDYVSSDLRFQVRFEGRHVADNQITANGYADMIGPLDAGKYQLLMYYVAGTGASKDFKLCSNSMVDLRLVSQAAYKDSAEEWMCTSTRVPLPDILTPQLEEQVLIDSEYLVPSEGRQEMSIKIEDNRLIRIKATSADATFSIKVKSTQTLAELSRSKDSLELVLEPGAYTLTISISASGSKPLSACSTFQLNMFLIPHSMVPVCPWSPSSRDQSAVANAQRQASDHIGNVLVDLMPTQLSKEMVVKPPVTFWMASGMQKAVPLSVDSAAAVRIDVSIQPPFLPLEVTLMKRRDSGKLEAPVGTAEWTESRLLLMYNDLPAGEYDVIFNAKRQFLSFSGTMQDLSDLCAHLTVSAEVGISSKEAVNSMRAELLDLPDLLAVQPFPSSMNMVGWLSGMLTSVGTQVYKFGAKEGDDNKATLKLEEKALLRIVSEPADLSNADIMVELRQNGQGVVAQSDSLGQVIAEVNPGSYELVMLPKAAAPFLLTLGMAYESRLRTDLQLADSGRPCSDNIPDFTSGVNFQEASWSIGPAFVRLGSRYLGQQGALFKVPISLTVSSVIYIEAGSALPLDLVRVALQVPEGLWVGEQRGYRSSLEIEIPPGKYSVEVGQPKPSHLVNDIQRCLDFSLHIRATPVNPEESKAKDTAGKEMAIPDEAAVDTAACFSMGTVALPLDFSDPGGGSTTLGGPIDQDGRLLIRSNVLLTDMHDGRKKVFLQTGNRPLQLKLGIILGGYARLSLTSQVAFSVTDARSKSTIKQLEYWSMADGWERVYRLDSNSEYWLAWRHPHRERTESACQHFGLMLESHPVQDMSRMMQCSGSSISPEEMFPSSLDFDGSSNFKYSKPQQFISQIQRGFLTKTKFRLTSPTWVGVDVGFNFFASHAEMDIVSATDADSNTALVPSELEPKGAPGSVLNARLMASSVLPPGDYLLRVADDHYKNQLDGMSSACFAFSIDITMVPESARPPGVLSVSPLPSVPLVSGVDVVLTIRFSEPPRGSVEEVVSKFSFGGIQAESGGSVNAMEAQYADAFHRKSTVQATTSEGHKVWVIGWNGKALAGLKEAQLNIGALEGSVSGQQYQFNPPTYSIVAAPKGAPWSGGAETIGKSASLGATDISSVSSASSAGTAVTQAAGDVGEMRPESPSVRVETPAVSDPSPPPPPPTQPPITVETESEDAGEIRIEGTARAAPSPPAIGSVNGLPEDHDGEVRVEGGSYLSHASVTSADISLPAAQGPASDLPRVVQDWDDAPKSSSTTLAAGAPAPTGHQLVVLLSLGAVALVGIAFMFPQFRRGPESRRSRQGRQRSTQSKYQVPEEEIGLVAAEGFYQDDDDIL
eukprot:TRINITY_DN27623_c0_g1_i1.p1 TRINITY_DN27623_c0_g1~~TRINITY_DN27623_c0_g1_i1.p1  ORF type:complete len:1920 (-),score=347.57 TRINITY_DN27623_c0_g1_i1:48-5807(-)